MDTNLHLLQSGCEVCGILLNPPENDYIIAQSTSWRITLAPDQFYPGRVFVTTLRHVRELSQLDYAEWQELHQIIKWFEPAVESALGATHLTWAALMNNAYRPRDNPKAWHPHVHWHVRPRYANSFEMFDISFKDEEFGHHHLREDHSRRLLPNQYAGIQLALQGRVPQLWLP